MSKKNWRESVVYQIYPKSFNDSNNDGIGDLRGVIEKLDYLKELGIDYIWLTPFYLSPQRDNGYDIEDYYNIDPTFGTMKDFEELVVEAKVRDIDIMLDMVFNHSSTEHNWFKEVLKGNEKYKNYYIFKKGKGKNPPTNWQSKFGGNAWEYVEELGEYYLHLFDKTQADLNWENEELREEIYKVVNFWMGKGVKGFRLDVINLISKPFIYEDDTDGDGRKFYTDGPKIHEFLKELNKNSFGKSDDIITVGEMSSTTIGNCIRYSNEKEKELSMVFNFHHLKVDYENGDKWTLKNFDFMELKNIFDKWQSAMEEGNGWNAVFWCNHDQPRILSRFGDEINYPRESAKMLATTIHLLRGTPYIYQGEEIGMTNPHYENINQYRDVESINYHNILKEEGKDEEYIMEVLKSKSRDNSRTPVQWDDSINGGFSKVTPWMEVGKNYKEINAKKVLEDKDSVFYHYKNLIELRKKEKVIVDGTFEMILKEDDKIFSYIRELDGVKLLVINNFYGEKTEFNLPEKYKEEFKNKKIELLLSNYKDSKIVTEQFYLNPYESLIYKIY
ncbi:MAG: alpha,alpha-phosphotrehalase [Sarcina sp.]